MTDEERRLISIGLFELRALLSGQSDDPGPAGTAARFAYALHNAALAALEDRPIDIERTLAQVSRLEPELGRDFVQHIRRQVAGDVA